MSDNDKAATGQPGGLNPEMLVREHASAVLSVCLAHTRNVHDGEDVMQEVFLKAISKLSSLRDHRLARAWLLQIARRTCIDRHRRAAHAPACSGLSEDVAEPQRDTDDRIGRLHSAIGRLPEIYREPILLYYLNGHSCTSVAKSLGLSESAVRSRLARARLQLHEMLSEDSL